MATEPLRLRVAPEAAGTRLDRFLTERVPDASRGEVQAWIADGALRLDGRVETRAARRLQAGASLELRIPARPAPPDAPLPAPEILLQPLYEDRDLIVLDKEAGRVVHPGPGHEGDTLVNALAARDPALVPAFEGSFRAGVVHRLDRETSGVIVFARHPAAAEALKAQFAARAVEKRYLAIVSGVPSPAEGLVDAPIARDPRRRQRMAVVAGGRPSRTRYRVLDAAGDRALVEARPETGRTHQIRVHLQAIGHPVLGDRLYGRASRHIDRVALHAAELAFEHPTEGRRLRFAAPLPADFLDALRSLGLARPEIAG